MDIPEDLAMQEPIHVPEDPVGKALATYIASLDHLPRIAGLTQEFIESARTSFATEDAAEIVEAKRDAETLIEQHLAANRAVYEAGLEYNRSLKGKRLG